MSRLLILPAVAAVCVVETWRRGFAQPIVMGLYEWGMALHVIEGPHTENDLLA